MKRNSGCLAVLVVLVCVQNVQGGHVLEFDGDDRVTIPDSPSLNPSAITVELRVNFGSFAIQPAQMLVAKGNDQASGSYRLFQEGGAGHLLTFALDHYRNPSRVHATPPLETDRWYHLAGTYDGNTLRLLLDGEPIASNVVGSIAIGNTSPLYLSHNDFGGHTYPLTGQMDEVRIWDYARSAEEIQATMGGPLTGSEPGLVGYWNFNEALGSQPVLDASANGNNGYLGTTNVVDDADPARVIPEPSTLILLLAGALGLLTWKPYQ